MLKQEVHIHTISVRDWTTQGLISSRGKGFFFSKTSRPALGHTESQIQVGVVSFLPGGITVGAWIWPLSLHLVPRLRMSGAVPPLPLNAFMACTGTALSLSVCSADICHLNFGMGSWFVMFRKLKRTRSEVINLFNPLKTKRRLLYLKTQFVPRSKHFSSRL